MEEVFTVVNRLGLHARPSARLVQTANRFQAEVFLRHGDHEVNGKSIMGVLMLAAGQGSRIRVRVEGEDAKEAMEAIRALFARGFDEEEG